MNRINNVRWDITGYCNLKCKHCQAMNYYENKEQKNNDLNFKDICTVIDKLKALNVGSIGLLGGEPLIRKDIFSIFKYIKKQNITLVLNTNGILITSKNVNNILNYCDNIIISLDGITSQTHDWLRGSGSFSKTLHGINLLLKNRTDKNKIGISFVLNRYNYNQTIKLSAFCNTLKIDFCLVDVVHETGNAIKNWNDLYLPDQELLESIKNLILNWNYDDKTNLDLRMYTNLFRDKILKENGIKLPTRYIQDSPGISSIYLLNDATVLPNQFLAYLEGNEKFKSYSLLNKSFQEITESEDFNSFLNLYNKKSYLKTYVPCNKCNYSGKECQLSPVSFLLNKKTPIRICNIINKQSKINQEV